MSPEKTFIAQHEAERMARREQAKAVHALFASLAARLFRRRSGGLAQPGAAH